MIAEKHREQHSENERLFWAKHGIDPLQVASALYGCSGDDDAAQIILDQARENARTMVKHTAGLR